VQGRWPVPLEIAGSILILAAAVIDAEAAS